PGRVERQPPPGDDARTLLAGGPGARSGRGARGRPVTLSAPSRNTRNFMPSVPVGPSRNSGTRPPHCSAWLGAILDVEIFLHRVLAAMLGHRGAARCRGHRGRAGPAPGPGGGERAVEPGREVHRVVVRLAAEVTAGHRPGDLPVPDRLGGGRRL